MNKVQIVGLLVTHSTKQRRKELEAKQPARPLSLSRVRLFHLLTRRSLVLHQDASSKASLAASGAGAAVGATTTVDSCLEVRSPGGNTMWTAGERVNLHFCVTDEPVRLTSQMVDLSVAVNKESTPEWTAEVVQQTAAAISQVDLDMALAEVCVREQAYTAAIAYYSSAIDALSSKPSNEAASSQATIHLLLFKRARVQMHLGRPVSAATDLAAAVQHAPNFAEACLYHARISMTLGKWADANSSLEVILNTPQSEDKAPLQYKARLYRTKLENMTAVLDEATSALAVSEEAFSGGDGRCQIGEADRDVLKWTVEQLTAVLQVAPESVGIRLQRAKANLMLGNLGSAKSDATWGIRLSKHTADGYLMRGLAHLYAFDHSAATAYFKWCVKLDVEHRECGRMVRALKNRKIHATNATTTFKEGKFDVALEHYGDAISLLPGHCLHTALMRLQRCRCLIYMNRPADAAAECREAQRLDPELKDAELLARDAVSIAADYQVWNTAELKRRARAEKQKQEAEEKKAKQAEEKIKEDARKKAKEEADKAGEEYVDPHPEPELSNATAIDVRRYRDWHEEWHMKKKLNLCEGHYFRLNMSSFKTRQKRCKWDALQVTRTRCGKLRGCSWQPEVVIEAGEDDGSQSWLDSIDEEMDGQCNATEVTVSDVKRAYRRMALVWHPDKKHRPHAKAHAEKIFLAVRSFPPLCCPAAALFHRAAHTTTMYFSRPEEWRG
jgi:tetratricopeptide (TPR) repeat protein